MKILNLILALALVLFSAVTFAQAVDINTASSKELQSLKGISSARAAAIIKYREENGPFASVDDLTKVPGIKKKRLENLLANNKGRLVAGEEAADEIDADADAEVNADDEMPMSSSTPEMPKTPAMPSSMKAPEMPSTSKMPEMPKTPAMPKAPTELPKQ